MDIYAVNDQEGYYLANRLEELRRKHSGGKKIMVRSSPSNKDKVSRFKNVFLLEHGTSAVFSRADFYMFIDTSEFALVMILDVCHIIYHLYEKDGWKFIEIEIIDADLCDAVVPNKTVVAGRAEAAAFQILASYAVTCGFHNAFHPESATFLTDIFERIASADELKKDEFGLESKIIALIYQAAKDRGLPL